MRHHRHGLGLSLEKVAELSGLHWTYVGSVERGERNVSLMNILKIADALGVDAAVLVGGITGKPG